ncbi:MAG: PadR family transcriptional regulator [Anaerolineales bacterium]|jgi:DNA-binding PadR family transcriptional regulator
MERKLLLLGLLRQHEMYGYQINDLIDAHLGANINLTKPTAYRLLHNMAEQGWISYREEKVGKRPTRRIYSLTEKGDAEFQEMLRCCLGQYQPSEHTSTLCLAFFDALPPEEVLPLLEKRRLTIEELIVANKSDQSHHGAFQLTIDHQIRHLVTDLEWLSEVITRLESSDWGLEVDIKNHPSSQ